MLDYFKNFRKLYPSKISHYMVFRVYCDLDDILVLVIAVLGGYD